jgi:hypothetical protein
MGVPQAQRVSKGGKTVAATCQMLCKTDNRSRPRF